MAGLLSGISSVRAVRPFCGSGDGRQATLPLTRRTTSMDLVRRVFASLPHIPLPCWRISFACCMRFQPASQCLSEVHADGADAMRNAGGFQLAYTGGW